MAGELRSVQVGGPNGTSHVLRFRHDTSDYPCIEEVFQLEQYSMRKLSRSEDLSSFVNRRRASGERPLIIDAGANIGARAVFFAMVYPDARIIAIEPEARNFALLRANTEGLDVECLNAGLSSAKGHLKVANPAAPNWAFRI